jgi:hypothetical protein
MKNNTPKPKKRRIDCVSLPVRYRAFELADAMCERGYAPSIAQAFLRALRAEAASVGLKAEDFATLVDPKGSTYRADRFYKPGA